MAEGGSSPVLFSLHFYSQSMGCNLICLSCLFCADRRPCRGPGWHNLGNCSEKGGVTAGTPQELESILELHVTRFGLFSLNLAPFGAVHCDQTIVWATRRVMGREEVGQSLQGRVRFILRVRLQHGNNRNCSIGAFSARRRWLGIFAVAALTRRPDKCVRMLFDSICGCPEENRLRA